MLLCKVKHWRRRCQVYLSGKEGKDYLFRVSLHKEGISAAKVYVGISPGEWIYCLIIGGAACIKDKKSPRELRAVNGLLKSFLIFQIFNNCFIFLVNHLPI
jgi:hypothetical protein